MIFYICWFHKQKEVRCSTERKKINLWDLGRKMNLVSLHFLLQQLLWFYCLYQSKQVQKPFSKQLIFACRFLVFGNTRHSNPFKQYFGVFQIILGFYGVNFYRKMRESFVVCFIFSMKSQSYFLVCCRIFCTWNCESSASGYACSCKWKAKRHPCTWRNTEFVSKLLIV